MDSEDRQAIEGLFERIRKVETEAENVDQEAVSFIKGRVAEQPAAPYFMAQTIVMQDYALQDAQRRIEELEAAPSRSGGFLSTLFGGGPARGREAQPSAAERGGPGSPGRYLAPDQRRGGGFLAGAAQTAMGVAGGVLLGSALGSLFGSEAQADDGSTSTDEDAGSQDDSFDGGDDF